MTFTGELWVSIAPIYDAILRHPFLRGLTDGSLARDAFQYYVIQDAHYLRDFARALSIAAARAPREDWIIMLNEHSAGALRVERSLHETFFRDFGLTEKDVAAVPLAPTNLAYTSYLLAVAYSAPFHEALAALLPCYWIYWQVGKTLRAQGSPDPFYQRWIETYGGEEFGAVVEEVLALANLVGAELSAGQRGRLRAHVVTTTRYEWLFFEMGLRQERWPV
jgi:thiaminase/transcriptional activator TenA